MIHRASGAMPTPSTRGMLGAYDHRAQRCMLRISSNMVTASPTARSPVTPAGRR